MTSLSHNVRRARNDFAFAALMLVATSGGSLWVANSMDDGERFDLHSRLPKTAEMTEFANWGERLILIPCAAFPLLSPWTRQRRRKTYEAALVPPLALNPRVQTD